MFCQEVSNSLWHILEERPAYSRLYSFSTDMQGAGVRVETFLVWVKLKSGRRKKRREYYRMVRDATGAVLYDQLEDVLSKFVDNMVADSTLVPDIRISPERTNKLLAAALKQQREIDELIAQNVR